MGIRSIATVLVLSTLAAGCPTVDLGESPASPGACLPDPGYYRDVIWPEYLAPADPARSCVGQGGCHEIENGRSAFRLSVDEPIDHDGNYQVVTRFLNCASPDASSLFTKPLSGIDPHGGGDLIEPGSMPADVFLDWFEP